MLTFTKFLCVLLLLNLHGTEVSSTEISVE